MWTPQGYYISSLDGDKYVGWQINRGRDKAADYVCGSQLARRLFHPDIIVRTIELASAEAALRDPPISSTCSASAGRPNSASCCRRRAS